eukprot:CAMPEP_0113549348 /NCGR_PEP_ID=MMETSP0015_2-20120614/13386_1 /TAXON_ID=2838 /ORGANISM="Odontella" /LENGTH=140 /DNA_ID=CAMNT_0000450053 /DNA_START=189 /DNA_END=611 /DNA_ORIENTATION=- /assembly_acc=CAM_ASM_000160
MTSANCNAWCPAEEPRATSSAHSSNVAEEINGGGVANERSSSFRSSGLCARRRLSVPRLRRSSLASRKGGQNQDEFGNAVPDISRRRRRHHRRSDTLENVKMKFPDNENEGKNQYVPSSLHPLLVLRTAPNNSATHVDEC